MIIILREIDDVVSTQQTVSVSFTLTRNDLSFYKKDICYGSQPGDFEAFVLGGSDAVQVSLCYEREVREAVKEEITVIFIFSSCV